MNIEMKKIVVYFLLFIFLITAIIDFPGCANPIAPFGGPRDSLPPVLLTATPKDSSRNFNGNKIVFYFNEFVQVENAHENLIVSPTPKIEPTVDFKLRTVTIKIKDTLEANTTYSFNFGNAIKDVNEGNIAKNFLYVFSTGPLIDSLELRGRVLLAQTGKADSTLIVMLHRSKDDSALIKERPRYIAKLDSSGRFRFRNLPAGTFYLYALKDEGGQKKYLSKRQLFGFAEKPVTVSNNNLPVTLYAYVEKTEEKPAASSKPLPAVKTDKNKEPDKRLKFGNNLANGMQDLLGNLEFTFTEPLKKFDSSKVQLTDETFNPISNYTFSRDSTGKKLVLTYKWKENTAYSLIVDKEFAEDSAGRKIPRTDTLKFRTLKETDYGLVHIRFNNLDLGKNPVLQIMQGEEIKFKQKLTSKDFTAPLFKPGEYEIRVLFDDNNNGIWDAGDFFGKHQQPEKVTAIPKKLTVKANWDNDNVIEL
jgi:uncharacterized protein (DUF2141 family)